jgi:hypothetical protein
MKTLTQIEIDLLVSVLETAVELAQSSAVIDLRNAIHRHRPELHARNLQAVENAKQVLEIAKRFYIHPSQGKVVPVYAEQPEQPTDTLSVRDEAELRILAAAVNCYWANPATALVPDEVLVTHSKRIVKLWMKART